MLYWATQALRHSLHTRMGGARKAYPSLIHNLSSFIIFAPYEKIHIDYCIIVFSDSKKFRPRYRGIGVGQVWASTLWCCGDDLQLR